MTEKNFLKTRNFTKLIWFLFGFLFSLSFVSGIYLKKKPIAKFLGINANGYDAMVIDNPENFKWFIPKNNHKIKSFDELKKTRNKLRNYIINKKPTKEERTKNEANKNTGLQNVS